MVNLFKKTRFDCIVIWGHGEVYLDDVLKEIRGDDHFDIVHIHKEKVKNIKKLVYQIYSFDYAPLFHLKAKVKYLEKTPPVVNFIFVKNHDVHEEFFGTGDFRHKESLRIKAFKEKIRDRFNPRDDKGQITHDHVIHATDNESQTDAILKLLGYTAGVALFANKNKIIETPHYIQEPSEFYIQEVSYSKLLCSNIIQNGDQILTKHLSIEESIQYRGLTVSKLYEDYVSCFRGTALKQDYIVSKYHQLQTDFLYLATSHASDFVTVTKIFGSDKFLVLDGLHRASLHLHQGNQTIKVCVI
jgi:hypothetical protein